MGKRKRRADPNKASTSDFLPPSSQMDTVLQQEPSPEVENSAATPISSILGLADDSVKLQKVSQLPVHQHRFSRAMFLRNPNLYTRKYSRRNMGSHADASNSHAKVIPSHDENMTSKMANRSHSDDFERKTESLPRAVQRPDGIRTESLAKAILRPDGIRTESLARAIQRPDVIRSSPLSTDAPSHNMGSMCRICNKLLKKKPEDSGHSFAPVEPSVVAVLVCGHLYHADCLEEETSQEERMDPPCPLCRSLTSHGSA